MRKILFKGKRVDNGEWVQGSPRDDIRGAISAIDFYDGLTDCETVKVIPETVGQFTGLTDKKGSDIFEGDIVEAYKFGEEKHVKIITFKNGCFWFGNWNFTEFLDKFRMHKVIGNINDNPELLEESNE